MSSPAAQQARIGRRFTPGLRSIEEISQMPNPNAITSEAEAVAAIEAEGYSNVTNCVQHGATWHASATDSSGNACEVLIDGQGRVKEKGDDEEPEPEPKREA